MASNGLPCIDFLPVITLFSKSAPMAKWASEPPPIPRHIGPLCVRRTLSVLLCSTAPLNCSYGSRSQVPLGTLGPPFKVYWTQPVTAVVHARHRRTRQRTARHVRFGPRLDGCRPGKSKEIMRFAFSGKWDFQELIQPFPGLSLTESTRNRP